MPRAFIVARREYLETVRTRTFLIGLLLPPAMMALMIFFTGRMEHAVKAGPRPALSVIVSDQSGKLAGELQKVFKRFNESNPQRPIFMIVEAADDESLMGKVRQGSANGALVIPAGFDTGAPCRFYSKIRSVGDEEILYRVRDLLNTAAANLRLSARGLSPDVMAELRRQIPIEEHDVATKQASSPGSMGARMMIPFAFMFFIFMGIYSMNAQMLTAVIEEKSSRVMEVLLSTLTPFQLMSGKILGMAAIGFTMIAFWGSLAYASASAKGLTDIGSPSIYAWFVAYYVLGFLLFSSIFVAIGSVCNSIKEAQNLIAPMTIVMIVPMMGWFYFAQHPESPATVALSLFPLTSPMVMVLRIVSRPETSVLEILSSLAILAASIPAVMWASAKIFRTGVLMYGKPPTLPEMVRWLRYK